MEKKGPASDLRLHGIAVHHHVLFETSVHFSSTDSILQIGQLILQEVK